jgi:hypothetical protein
MINYVHYHYFCDGLADDFSKAACSLLWDTFTQYEHVSGEILVYDPIAIRCEYSEMTFGALIDEYNIPITDNNNNKNFEVLEWLDKHTKVIGVTYLNSVVFKNF